MADQTEDTLPPPPEYGKGGGSEQDQEAVDRNAFLLTKENEAFAFLRNLGEKKRKEVLNYLRRKGYSSGYEVSNDGFGEADIRRTRDFLVNQFVLGIDDYQKGLDYIRKYPDQPLGSDGASKRTPAADVDAVFKNVVQQQLGRTPTATEMERFRNAYAGMEGGANPPSVTAAAQQQVTKTAPGEEQATKFADFAATFENMLRGA